MDPRCREALIKMNLPHLIDKFTENHMDYNALLLLKEFPDAISTIVPNFRDGLMLRKGLQSLKEETNLSINSFSEGEYMLPVVSLWTETSLQPEISNCNEQKGINLARSEINSVRPEINSVRPEINSVRPEINSVRPEINSVRPEINSVRPEINSVRPEINSVRPEINSVRPEINSVQSEINSTRPEIHQNKRIRINSDIEENNQLAQKNYIQEVLERTAIGKSVLSLHRLRGLENVTRCKLAELVIYAEFGDNTNTLITKSRFLELANLVVQCFPDEFPETYYIPSSARGKGRAASGKFYDAYTNLNKTLRKAKLRSISFPPSFLAPLNSYTAPSLCAITSQQEDFQIKRQLEFIRSHLEPWEEFKACWESTCLIRQKQLREDSGREDKVEEYVNRYPALKQPGSHILLEMDFANLYKEAQHNWTAKWPLFCEKVKEELVKSGIKEERLDCDAALIYEIPKLFGIIPIRIPGRKPWRATRGEIQEGFLVHLKSISSLQKTLERMRETAEYRGTQLQLFPLIVGDSIRCITSSYVVIDCRPFPVESPLRAVEVAFKAYHALNCHYPVQSARVWTLLAKAVFVIEAEWERGMEATPEMRRLLQKLQC